MAKLSTITVSYEMIRQPSGQYTSDKMGVSATITYEENEKPDLLTEIKIYSGQLKLACEKRIGINKVPVETK
jgi:hypothetical protein